MISTAVFDLETSNLGGDTGVILCACVESSMKPGKIITLRSDDMAAEDWNAGRRGNDKPLVKELANILSDHDILVAHNGTRFDVPFIRTRLMRWGLKKFPDQKIIDPLSLALRKLRLERNSLGRLSDLLGIEERKTPLDLSVWTDAVLNGTRRSMNLIVEHCIADVKVLTACLEFVKPYIKVLDDRGSAL